MHTVTTKLGEETFARLEAAAEMLDRKKSYLVRRAVEDLLEELEDLRIAHERTLESRATGERGIPLEELIRQNGLDV